MNYLLEWDYQKNSSKIEETPLNREVFWICSLKHSWKARINDRRDNRRKCPYCHHGKFLSGFNDIATKTPYLTYFWSEKNIKDPKDTSLNEKIFLKCSIGHEWKTTGRRWNNTNNWCPYCSGRLAIIKTNDTYTLYPHLLKEYSSNNKKKLEEYKPQSNKNVLWICELGHEYSCSVQKKIMRNDKCSYCSNKKVLVGFNDLYTRNEFLANEWDYNKNILTPKQVIFSSLKKYWWICHKCSYSWEANIYNRNILGHGCSRCQKSRKWSFLEKDICNFVKKISFSEVLENAKILGRKEVDILIPDLNVAIEVNGDYWHSNNFLMKNGLNARAYHTLKKELCKEKGLTLLFVWESDWKHKEEEIKAALELFFKTGVIMPILERLE